MKFVCQTLFDITATGTTGHYRHGRPGYHDRAAQLISDQAAWNLSRNQQRNWETITQILSLRTQLFGLTNPVVDQTGTRWMFEFETETDGVYGPESDPVSVLRSDAAGVPMLSGLKNQPDLASVLVTEGPDKNIWFAAVPINTI
jgi:hypothetical protein